MAVNNSAVRGAQREELAFSASQDIQSGMYKIQELREDLEIVRDKLEATLARPNDEQQQALLDYPGIQVIASERLDNVEEFCSDLAGLETELEGVISHLELTDFRSLSNPDRYGNVS